MKLIVEMEMPERCGACKCRHVEFDIDRVAVFCAIKDNEYVEDPDSRPSWCPIKGVLPEEHGDLIDRDRLEYRVMAETNPFGKPTIEYESGIKVMQMIEDAFTVIAAERKDDE